MNILAELDRLAALYPPPPAYPPMLLTITCPQHGRPEDASHSAALITFDVVAAAKEMYAKAIVRALPCGCVLILPKEEALWQNGSSLVNG